MSMAFNKKYFCPYCNEYKYFKNFGYPKRKKVLCPECYSLERHRFAYYVYKQAFLNSDKQIKLLHTAPEKCIAEEILKNPLIDYVPIDLEPQNYKFVKCQKEDVTKLTFSNNSFDFIISNHVMEHISDEKAFLSEMLRVLKPAGKLYLMIPIFFNCKESFEDSSITSDEDRLKYYGQADHVRKYGCDVIKRLKKYYGAEIIHANKYGMKNARIDKKDIIFVITKK